MEESLVEMKIDHLKPVMKTLSFIEAMRVIPNLTVSQVKVDGEFSFLAYNRIGFKPEVKAYTLNKWGKLRTDFPALNQFVTAMNQTSIESAELLCELYAKEGDKPLKLPQFIHYVKSKNSADHEKIHMGIWELLKINEHPVTENRLWRYQEVASWLKNSTHVSVLPYIQPKTKADIEAFWKHYVETLRYEGLVIRNNDETWKLKPAKELDAVIIGINKKSGYGKENLFAQQQVTSLHLALMTPEGNFVEIGDCASGINHQLRSALWRLMEYKVGENDKTVFIQPIAVVTVECTDLFKAKNKLYKITPQGYSQVGDMNLIRLRHPRLKSFRTDKSVNPTDLRLTQIPQEYLEEEKQNRNPFLW